MTQTVQASIAEHFGLVTDPRNLGVDHLLIEIITIALCGVICGADNWVEIEQFGQAKEKWLRKFLILPNGIPSHDTFGWVFGVIDPHQFQSSFAHIHIAGCARPNATANEKKEG